MPPGSVVVSVTSTATDPGKHTGRAAFCRVTTHPTDYQAQEAMHVPLFKSEEQKAAAAAEKAQAAFDGSPVGRARAAKAAGRRYFQVVTQVTNSKGSATFGGNTLSGDTSDHTGLIESIENEGWALHDVGYVFQETGSDSKSKAIGSGERTAVSGRIMGIYLFKVT
jgi:hypothetical protein